MSANACVSVIFIRASKTDQVWVRKKHPKSCEANMPFLWVVHSKTIQVILKFQVFDSSFEWKF